MTGYNTGTVISHVDRNHCVIRTDLMAGTKNPDKLVSLRVYSPELDAYVSVPNGTIVELKGYEEGQREVMRAELATAESNLADCAIVAAPEVMYDERKKNLGEYINEAGKAVRGYRLVDRNLFSLTEEGFVVGREMGSDTVHSLPTVGSKVGIGAGGRLDTAKEGFGRCVHIETVGRYTYYTIEITMS